MLLSEMFGVERDTDFKVKGYESRFRLTLNVDGFEQLKIKHPGIDMWGTPLAETIFNVISVAPAGIIHLPPPLTDEQREQLKAIWTLGGRWLAKDADRDVYAYSVKPEQDSDWAEWVPIKYDEDELQFTVYRDLDVCDLVSWSDPEPYDIGKALGVTE
jgi:hypothetical protein